MKSFILTTVAVAAVLGCTIKVDAASPRSGSHSASHARVATHGHVATNSHVAVHAHRTLVVRGHSVNVPFHVRGYGGWGSRCWFPSYRSYGYYCDTDQLWYYWYAPLNEYLPITYMSIYPPTQVVAPVGIVSVTPGLPVTLPMSSALPPGATLVPGPITAP
jgi:hypothetical protein